MNFIFDKEAKTLFADDLVLVQGEDRETVFKIPLEIDPDNEYNCFFEFKLPGGETFIDSLVRTPESFEYTVTRVLTFRYGRIDFQLVMYKREGNSVYKTIPVIKGITVKKSINASDDGQLDINHEQKSMLFDLINSKMDTDEYISDKEQISDSLENLQQSVSNLSETVSDSIDEVSQTLSAAIEEYNTETSEAIATTNSSVSSLSQSVSDLQGSTVKFTEQTLSESEKAIARSNLDVLKGTEIFQVNSVYITFSTVSPAALLGGTWARLIDKFLVAAGEKFPAGTQGGSMTHTLTLDEIPSHSHTGLYYNSVSEGNNISPVTGGGSAYGSTIAVAKNNTSAEYVTGSAGGGQPHSIIPPYYVVFMWKRVA